MSRRAVLLCACMLSTSCSRTLYEAHFAKPADISKISEPALRSPFLKCHMADGRVIVLEKWAIEEGANLVRGEGIEYSASRDLVSALGPRTIKLDDIAILETNRPYDVDVATGSVVALAIGTGASLALTVVCAANTTACFGVKK